MKMIRYFFECCFNQSEGFDDLDRIIEEFKSCERDENQLQLIRELYHIMQTNNYVFTTRFINKYGSRTFKEEKVEKLIKFLYDKMIDRPTDVKAEDFIKKCRVVFCPVCTPDPEVVTTFGIIDKATVIGKDLKIYICKPCKLVWLDENNIQADSAQDYKKFMKTLSLKGLWRELKDVDTL